MQRIVALVSTGYLARSVLSVDSLCNTFLLVNRGVMSPLLLIGKSTDTVTEFVELVIVLGVMVIFALRAPTTFSSELALAMASAEVAPGTIALRAAS